MTTYEVISIVIGILALLVSLIGLIVKLIIELINAKKQPPQPRKLSGYFFVANHFQG